MSAIVELQITDYERKSIALALPLIEEIAIPNPVNACMYSLAYRSALTKLNAGSSQFSVGEIRAISLAVSAAILICTGKGSEITDSPVSISGWKDKLVPHYFALNKLAPILDAFLDGLPR